MATTRIPIHGYLLRHGPGSRVRVTVNDLPLYGGVSHAQDSTSGVLNHLMVPGTNVLRAEVLHGDRTEAAAYFEVDARGSDTYPRAVVSWLDDVGTVKDFGILDWAGEATFESEEGLPRPMWLDAPPEEVPEDGTDELRAEIAALSRAFERADGQAVYRMFSLKAIDMDEMMKTKWSAPETVREMMVSTLDRPWQVDAMPDEATTYRSIQGGKLVHVGRLDATPLFRARRIGTEGDEPVEVQTDLVFMRHEGKWRIIR